MARQKSIKTRSAEWKSLNNKIIKCTRCPRLIRHCQEIAIKKRRAYQDFEYWGRPVPLFGPPDADLLIVGLAPGAHGANRTGRMFTGDRSGDWLYRALHRARFANQPTSTTRDDGLDLVNCAIAAVCCCAPPDNKPSREEQVNCQPFLLSAIEIVQPKVFLALGGIAWKSMIGVAIDQEWLTKPRKRPKFGHGAEVKFDNSNGSSDVWLIGSYHPSQQNTFTGRLTENMLDNVFKRIQKLI